MEKSMTASFASPEGQRALLASAPGRYKFERFKRTKYFGFGRLRQATTMRLDYIVGCVMASGI